MSENKTEENVFEKLGPRINKILAQSKLKGKEPTPIQEMAISPILSGLNTMLISETGTGKTLAVMLPVFSKMLKEDVKPISALYITPLKALNRDLLDRLIWWANKLELDIAVRHGDTSQYQRKQQMEFPPHILIVTLETLQPILTGKRIREHLRNIKYIILDEVHETVESKRGIQLALGLERLKKLCGKFQLIMLSATVGSPEKVAPFFSAGQKVEIVRAETPKQFDIKVISPNPKAEDSGIAKTIFTTKETAARLRAIMDFIKESRSSLTFTNTREFAEILASRIKTIDKNFPAEIHHSSLSKSVRIKTEERFKAEEIKSIVCVSGDTRILLADGSWRTINDARKSNLKITSLNDNLKLGQDKTPRIIKNGKKKTLKVSTKHGFELKCTKEHEFLTINNGKLEWIKAKNLKVGQNVAIIRHNPYNPEKKRFYSIVPDYIYVNISDKLFTKIKQEIKEKYKKYEDFSRETGINLSNLRHFLAGKKTNQTIERLKKIVKKLDIDIEELYNEIILIGSRNYTRHTMPKEISPSFCRLIGFLLADGTITRDDMLRLFNKDRKLLIKYEKILKDEFDINSSILKGTNCLVLQTHATWLCNVLQNIGVKFGRKARIVEIPEIIFQLPKKHQINFLNGYFDGDGCFQNSNGRTYSVLFTTFSKKMAQDIHLLLLSLGIISSVRHTNKKDDYIVGVLGGKNLRNFVKIFEIWKNKSKLNIFGKGYCNEDTIPSVGTLLKNLRVKTGVSTYFMQTRNGLNPYKYETNKRTISRKQLLNLIEIYSKEGGNPQEILESLATSDIFWDSISKIETSKISKVFDILDTENSNFIANGFITHNCTSSLQLGIDIGSIDLVLQYMSPRRVSQLIQRVGRSGHGIERVSKGLVIATDGDDCFEAAVIARRALAGEIEPTKSHSNSLDVLAHQIVGMTIEDWKLDFKQTYQLVKNAGPYGTLSFDDFMAVCMQLQQTGLVFLDGNIKKKRRGFNYYFTNLSTIPSKKQYRIFNTLDQSFVGVLDEEFIAVHGDSGTTFIVKGEPWRIIDTEDDRVLVEPSNDVDAAVPGWEGELIPVHFDVAQEVGALRRRIFEMLDTLPDNKTVEELMRTYPVGKNVARKMVKVIKKQKKHDRTMVTDDKNILIESYENVAVLHTCFGSVVNQTLGRFLAALLTARLGSVGLKTDPYRILIQFQQKDMKSNMEIIEEILAKTKPEYLSTYLEVSIAKSEMFMWRFVHVAKRFGAFSRDVQFGRTRMKNIIKDYANTPLFRETMSEIETEKLDMDKATGMLRDIQSGKTKLFFKKGISPLGKIGIKHKYAEVIGPERPTREIFELFKNRLMNTKTRLACMNCGDWTQMFVVKDVSESVKCPKCDAILLAVVHPRQSDITKIIQKHLKKKRLKPDEQHVLDRAKKTADLYISYKRAAVVMLAGRGVGPFTAKKILRRYHETVEDLLEDVLEAERAFLRTKRYWRV